MIRPILNSFHQLNLSEIKTRVKEAQIQEDADLVVIPVNVPEQAPICKNEQELRDYIRNAKITRRITHLFVHCTASQPHATVSSIQNHWRTLGWRNPGYHILLPREGFTVLMDFNGVSNGVAGFNTHGVHISYIGGINPQGRPLDTRTPMQTRLIEVFIEEMVKRFPNIKVLGHNEVAAKACPSFQVKKEYPKYWTGR
jgi:N-acetylmuramoyl-L-alanine amidase